MHRWPSEGEVGGDSPRRPRRPLRARRGRGAWGKGRCSKAGGGGELEPRFGRMTRTGRRGNFERRWGLSQERQRLDGRGENGKARGHGRNPKDEWGRGVEPRMGKRQGEGASGARRPSVPRRPGVRVGHVPFFEIRLVERKVGLSAEICRGGFCRKVHSWRHDSARMGGWGNVRSSNDE
jgi:hypothetical protein